MKSMSAVLMTGVLGAGCAATTLLEQADARMAAEDYSGASALYARFAAVDPGNIRVEAIEDGR